MIVYFVLAFYLLCLYLAYRGVAVGNEEQTEDDYYNR